jgi:hypothetical protein|tara:strand:- start:357 stop:827 length:471 start_codon:yes stop_codon:yes gene_type:complete
MENINDIKKIAKKYLKSPKIYKMRNKIQVVATSGAYMNLEHDPSGKSYEIIDPSDNLIGGGDYDVVMEPFAEFRDLLRSMKLEIKEVKESNVYEGIISTLFQRVIAGAKPKDVVKQATKNHPSLEKLEKEIERDLVALHKKEKELNKKLSKLPKLA